MSATHENTLPAATVTNWGLVRRMLAVGWHYRWGCLRLLLLQGLLLLGTLGTLRLTGYGIDLIRFHAKATDKMPPSPWDLHPPRDWPPLAQVAVIAGLVLALEVLRGSLNNVLEKALLQRNFLK